jgi:hypothetical protein
MATQFNRKQIRALIKESLYQMVNEGASSEELEGVYGKAPPNDLFAMLTNMHPAIGDAVQAALDEVVPELGKMPAFSGKRAEAKRAEWLADASTAVGERVEDLVADDPDAAAEWSELGYSAEIDTFNALLDAEIEKLASRQNMTRAEREADEERYSADIADTEKSLSRGSNFLGPRGSRY